MSKQGAALSLATAMTPSAAAAASALGAPWRRRQLMQTTRAASTSTTSSSPGPLPGVEPRDATADQAQERVNVQAPQANQHLPDPAAPDAPISLLQRVSESAQVPALPTFDLLHAVRSAALMPAMQLPAPLLPNLPVQFSPRCPQDMIRPMAATRGHTYHYAEDSAREVLREQLACRATQENPGVETM